METTKTDQKPSTNTHDNDAARDFQAAVDQIMKTHGRPKSPQAAEELYDKLRAVFS